jgi:hypothetical protein
LRAFDWAIARTGGVLGRGAFSAADFGTLGMTIMLISQESG